MKSPEQDVLIIIPAFNEEQRIGPVIRSVRTHISNAAVLVIDDGSTDDTAVVARSAGALVVRHGVNLGYGASLESGYKYALRQGYDILVQMDGDGQHVAEEIPKVLDPVLKGVVDISIGSRFLFEEQTYKTTIARRLGQRFFGSILYLLTGSKITDPTSGFQCLNKRAFDLFARGHFPDDFPDTDVLLLAHFANLRIQEVPVAMQARGGGASMHSGLRPLYYIVKMMLSMFMVILNRREWRRYV